MASSSILADVKHKLGGYIEGTAFDADIIMDINSTLSVLNQLGVGPTQGFVITGDTETWEDFIGDRTDLEMVKSYVYNKVRLMFDPPSNSFLIDEIRKQCSEFEWRLNVEVETPVEDSEVES